MNPAPIPDSWLDPQADGAALEVEQFPSVLMLAVSTLYQRNIFKPLLDAHGIGVADWRVLLSLNHYGEATAADIVSRSWMDKAQVSRAVLTLGAAGLIDTRPDPEHARRVLLRSTRSGSALYRKLLAQSRCEQARMLGKLSPAERRGLYQALQKVLAYVQASGA